MLSRLEAALWSWPLLVLILGTGLFLSLRLRFLPQRRLGAALRILTRPAEGQGVTPFAALCTSLSATIGTGNLVGVAAALALGGPGALLWMQLSAVTGMAVKYAEGYFAVRYRSVGPDGSPSGGPFAYILRGLGSRFRPLAAAFALCGAAAGLCGVGTFVQVGSMSDGLRYVLSRTRLTPSDPSWLPALLFGLVLAVLTALIIRGGIRRISSVCTVLVPVMGGLYVFCCLWVLIRCREALPGAVRQILCGAFRPRAAVGGLLGTVRAGISRGVFSNEAGLGTAPIAAAAAQTDDAAGQGLVCMTGVFFDTLCVCTLTGLAVLAAGTPLGQGGLHAVMETFASALPLPEQLGRGLVLLCLLLFAFTTVVGWNFYAVRCLEFLTGGRPGPRRIYQCLYVLTVLLAPFLSVTALWRAANVCNALMAIPNLTALLLLRRRLDARDIMMAAARKERPAHGTALSGRPRGRLYQAPRGPVHRRARWAARPGASGTVGSRRRGPHGPPAGPGGGRSDGPCPHRAGGLRSVRPDPCGRV